MLKKSAALATPFTIRGTAAWWDSQIIVHAVHQATICDMIDGTPEPSQSFSTWATRALRRMQRPCSCWRRHVARAATRILQGTPGPPVHVVAKSVHEQDAGGVGIASLVGHAEQWLSDTTLLCEVHVILELGASRFQSFLDL